MLAITDRGASRPRGRRLRARLPRLRPRGEPALRGGAAPGRARAGPEPARRVGGARHRARALRAGRQSPRHREPAAADPPLRPSRLLPEPSPVAPGPAPPGRGRLRARRPPLRERVRPHSDHDRLRPSGFGGAGVAARPVRASRSEALDPARGGRAALDRDAAPAVPRSARGDGARRRGGMGGRGGAPRAAARAREEVEERHAAGGGGAAAGRPPRLRAGRLRHVRGPDGAGGRARGGGGRQPRPARGLPRHAPGRGPARPDARAGDGAARAPPRQAPQPRPFWTVRLGQWLARCSRRRAERIPGRGDG